MISCNREGVSTTGKSPVLRESGESFEDPSRLKEYPSTSPATVRGEEGSRVLSSYLCFRGFSSLVVHISTPVITVVVF